MTHLLKSLALLCVTLVSSCVSQHKVDRKSHFNSFQDIAKNLKELDSKTIANAGPFNQKIYRNMVLRFSGTSITGDLVYPIGAKNPPLILIQHGNKSHKEAHLLQARRLATWGFAAISLQQRNRNNWVENGLNIKKFTQHIYKRGKIKNLKFDRSRIILMGHSFGGSAVTIAAGSGAPVVGLILLDPAVVSDSVMDYMKKVKQPVILIGADKKVFRSRRRQNFYKLISGSMSEISIRGATHDDAQYPSMFSIYAYGFDPFTNDFKRKLFLKAITTSAISLAATKKLDFAWQRFQDDIEAGHFKHAKRRISDLKTAH
jgi:dienelactone hydrolase